VNGVYKDVDNVTDFNIPSEATWMDWLTDNWRAFVAIFAFVAFIVATIALTPDD
jgi:hypothetical protein